MSLLNTPFWQDLDGNPRTGVNPPSLVMRSGRLTPQRHGEIQQIYMRFSLAKLTAVGDFFVFNRVLTDGTRVRIESMQGRDRVMVWASDAQSEDPWDRGWSFIPANDASLGGFLRRPGATPGDLSAAAFMPVGNFASPAGKAVHTFVDATTGNRHLCTDREGGARMWRGDKSAPVLTYDSNTVWVDGVKSVLSPRAPAVTTIWGAAIAKRGNEQWLVFVADQRLWAVRLKDLKPRTTACVDCGSVVGANYAFWVLTRWEFSPDGMRAIALGGFDPSMGSTPVRRGGIYRIQLVPENGTVPFRLEVSEQLREMGVKKRTSSTFRFNQAKRDFTFHGWRDFALSTTTNYYGVIKFDIDSGWGPFFTASTRPQVTDASKGLVSWYLVTGSYFDPRMSIHINNQYVPHMTDLHTDPTNFSTAPFQVSIPRSDIAYDDGYAPDEIILARHFVPRRQNTPKPTRLDGYGMFPPDTAFYFDHLDGWLVQNWTTETYFYRKEEVRWDPHEGAEGVTTTARTREHMGVQLVRTESRFGTPTFPTFAELGAFCDARWGASQAALGMPSISSTLYSRYSALLSKTDYTSFLSLFEYLAGRTHNLQGSGDDRIQLAGQLMVVDLAGGTTKFYGNTEAPPNEAEPGEAEFGEFTEVWPDGTVHPYKALVRLVTGSGGTQSRTFTYTLGGITQATPVYTNNWTTDWVLGSQVFLTGKAYIAAGYDAKGQERFLCMEGDDSKVLRYESSAKANNEPAVQLAWRFSGAMGYRLVLDGEVIDSCTYAVADAVTLPDNIYRDSENASGPSPEIRAGHITVHDFDIALGHVLYRKSEEVFSAVGTKPKNRRSSLSLSYCDFLKTPKAKHQLGEEKVFTSKERGVDSRFALFDDTKALFGKTAPFTTVPDSIVINGSPEKLDLEDFASLVPQEQRNEVGPLSGLTDTKWSMSWVTTMMLYMPGVDHEVCPIPEKIFYWHAIASDEMSGVGRFTKPPKSSLALRAYSDDCWMVCYQNEMHIQSTSTDNTTARYFLKLAKNKPVVEFDAAVYFKYLGLSKKLLAPKFHIRKKT